MRRDAGRPGRALSTAAGVRGSMLLESLIALLVLAVTVLGTVAGFVHALRGSHSALLQSRAQNLASDLAERIRVNPQAREAYAAAGATLPMDCEHFACDAAQIAAHDLQQWRQAVAATLSGNATAQLSYVAGAQSPDRYRITLSWLDPASLNIASLVSLVEVAP